MNIIFNPSAVTMVSIAEFSNTRILIDIADTSGVTASTLQALVKRGPYSRNADYTTVAVFTTASQPSPIVQPQSALFRKGVHKHWHSLPTAHYWLLTIGSLTGTFTILGSNFGITLSDVQVYLSTPNIILSSKVIAVAPTNLTIQLSSLDLSSIQVVEIVVSVKGLRSSPVMILDAYTKPQILSNPSSIESPLEGGVPIMLTGRHLNQDKEVYCTWNGEFTAKVSYIAGTQPIVGQ